MATEVERRFLLDDVPDHVVTGEGAAIRQGYLAEEGDVAVRVRITGGEAILTVKAGGGLERTEVELTVDRAEADDLWPHTAGRRIEKVRHRVELDGVTAEVDIFGGALEGLRIVEVEFDSADAAGRFEPPAWFGREVTGESRWSNAALARNGIPR